MTKVKATLAGRSFPARVFYWTVRTALSLFCRVWNRMTIEGREHLPREGAYVVVPVHRSILDTPITAAITHSRLRFMGADKYWKGLFGRILSALGAFPVTRGAADREALKRMIQILEGGEPLVLFPEGERKSGPIVQPLFDGAAFVAAKVGVPLIPVAIAGSERALPKGAKFIRPAKVHVLVGEPLVVPPTANSKERREAIHGMTELLRARLQDLYERATIRVG